MHIPGWLTMRPTEKTLLCWRPSLCDRITVDTGLGWRWVKLPRYYTQLKIFFLLCSMTDKWWQKYATIHDLFIKVHWKLKNSWLFVYKFLMTSDSWVVFFVWFFWFFFFAFCFCFKRHFMYKIPLKRIVILHHL